MSPARNVVATGTDGYKALFSLGELSPDFGNQPDFIAFGVNGGSLNDKGFARIVAPNDIKAGRWVSNLASLEVYHATAVPEPATVVLMLVGVAATLWTSEALRNRFSKQPDELAHNQKTRGWAAGIRMAADSSCGPQCRRWIACRSSWPRTASDIAPRALG